MADLQQAVVQLVQRGELHTFVEGLPPEDVAAIEAAAAELTGRRSYRDDPVRWVLECIDWKEGEGPTPYQIKVLEALRVHKRVAVRSLHGIGKTTIEAWVVLWFATTRDPDDWKCPTTAGVWRQLKQYLWPEIHKWAKRLRWDRLGRGPFVRSVELLLLELKLDGGNAFAVASDDPAKIEGVHADSVCYLYDEAKSIAAATFDASEGAFAGAGADTGQEAFALAMSTPGAPTGRFYDIHRRKPGLEDWFVVHVTLQDAIDAGRVSDEWARRMARQWGVDSAAYKNRVLGEFAAEDEEGVIPLAWVELAVERWHAWRDDPKASGVVTAQGVDVARFGTDKTVIALRCGPVVARLNEYSRIDTTTTTQLVKDNLHRWPKATAIVDVIGIGAGVYDQLIEANRPAVPFNAAEGTDLMDSSGTLGFANKRSAAWWGLRERLDPSQPGGSSVALPPDDELTGDLTTPRWRTTAGGKIQVESREDIRKRLGRSPDKGTAVVQSFWLDGGAPMIVKGQREPDAKGEELDDMGELLTMGF